MVNINIKLPQKWADLSDQQAKDVISIIFLASDMSQQEALLLCAMRLSGVRMLKADADGALVRIPRQFVEAGKNIISKIHYERLRFLISEVKWILDMPNYPWRPNKMLGAYPIRANLEALSFGKYLEADALYQGYMAKKDPKMIDRLAYILIPKRISRPLAEWEIQALMIWFASAKIALSKRFPDLFRPAGADGQGSLAQNAGSLQKNFDAQIRALTKGDPLKEDAVLNLDLFRAMTELNAQAAEYADLKSRLKK